MAEGAMDMELCPNCKKEIPQCNYVMHTVHCARNISICTVCKEPVPKNELPDHLDRHEKLAKKPASSSMSRGNDMLTQLGVAWKSTPEPKGFPSERLGHVKPVDYRPKPTVVPKIKRLSPETNGKPQPKLRPCKYCELELPSSDLKEHEEYCGTRTDKCNECGEFVMYKYKKIHEDSNHNFLKLSDEPGPKASWDSSTTRMPMEDSMSSRQRRNYANPSTFNMNSMYNAVDYMPSEYTSETSTRTSQQKMQEQTEYKNMSRRLDSKTEYIKNLLHDSACITAPLRSSATAPRNTFVHNYAGPAARPPPRRSPNPPSSLVIPCEFCSTPIPHEDLIQHETGCRPDLARFNPRRRTLEEDDYDDYLVRGLDGGLVGGVAAAAEPPPPSPEVELPCEFCADMIPASQLLRHQATCN